MPDDPSLLPQLLVLMLLILVNAFFAAAEIAVISLSETKLKKQAEEGDKKAKKLLALTPPRFKSPSPWQASCPPPLPPTAFPIPL